MSKLNSNSQSTLSKAAWIACKNLNPMKMFASPVMFIVLIGAVMTVIIALQKLISGQAAGFEIVTSVLLLFTAWFANFAEAIAEARGRGQADSLRSAKQTLQARRLKKGQEMRVPADQLQKGDIILVSANEYIPITDTLNAAGV